jgi:hypothetical protein
MGMIYRNIVELASIAARHFNMWAVQTSLINDRPETEWIDAITQAYPKNEQLVDAILYENVVFFEHRLDAEDFFNLLSSLNETPFVAACLLDNNGSFVKSTESNCLNGLIEKLYKFAGKTNGN